MRRRFWVGADRRLGVEGIGVDVVCPEVIPSHLGRGLGLAIPTAKRLRRDS
jgi:hypothetical protein